MKADRQALGELTVFRAFAQVCPLPIKPESIAKRNPGVTSRQLGSLP